MTNLSSMFDEIKERYRNPFFASFILAWFVWNWKIWIGLLWFDKDQLASESANNYVQFVQNNLHPGQGFWFPLFTALLIIILFPIIRNLIGMYQAFSANWGEKGVLKISKSGSIPTEIYLQKKHELIERVKRIESTAQDEQELLSELYELRTERISQEKELKVLRDANNSLTPQLSGPSDNNTLNGRWLLQPGFDGVNDIEIKIIQKGINQIDDKNKIINIGTLIFYLDYLHQKTICIKLSNGTIHFLKLQTVTGLIMEGRMDAKKDVTWRRLD